MWKCTYRSHIYRVMDTVDSIYMGQGTYGPRLQEGGLEKAAADVKVMILTNAPVTWFRWFPEIHRTLSISIHTQTSLFSQGLPP
jgi:hypothetical protein